MRVSELVERAESNDGGAQGSIIEDAWELIAPSFSRDQLARKSTHFCRCLDAGAWLDAAMTLVPEGWDSCCVGHTDDGRGYAQLAGNDGHMMAEDPAEFYVEAEAATPALALVAAALKARGGE